MMKLHHVAGDVARLPVLFVNVYFVGAPGGQWVLIDSGLPHSAEWIRSAAKQRYGSRPPEAIILTHGHFDHAGSALELASGWDVPVYAPAGELPYLTGRATYAPPDPTLGGFMGFASRFMPIGPTDLRPRLRTLNGEEAHLLPGWRRVETPGHSPGHISWFREEDGALIAGDAFATTDVQSWVDLPAGVQVVSRPPDPFTPDWESAKASVQRLASLEPTVLAAGHGIPMHGPEATRQLSALAANFQAPPGGRYSSHPSRPIDESGFIPLPPAPADPLPAAATVIGLGALVVAGFALASGAGRRRV